MRFNFSKTIYPDDDCLKMLGDSINVLVSVRCALEALKGITKEYDVQCYIDKLMDGDTVDLLSLHYGFILEYRDMCKKLGCSEEEFVKRYYDALNKYNATEKGCKLDDSEYPFY